MGLKPVLRKPSQARIELPY